MTFKAGTAVLLNPGFETKQGGTFLGKTETGQNANYTQDYVMGIEYQNTVIQAIYNSEGRLYFAGSTTRYEYTMTDHLGNARVSFTDQNADGTPEIIQENHYYPFGLAMEGPWVNDPAQDNNYQYNGKELNDDFGLGWMDYGARWYDASVGRWNGVDPLAENYFNFSPYNYTLNNPVLFIDPDGNAVYYSWDGKYLGSDGKDDNMVYAADKVTTNKKGNLKFHNAKSLGVNHDLFLAFASTVYNEASGSTETYPMANIIVNLINGGKSRLDNLEEAVMYDNSSFQGASQEHLDDYIDEDRASKNEKHEIDAVINALAGNKYPEAREKGNFKDYSNGANAWDGIDLVDTHKKNSHRYYKWSSSSKELLQKYRDKVNGGVKVENWKYVESNADISAVYIKGKTLFAFVPGGRGGNVYDKLVVKKPKP